MKKELHIWLDKVGFDKYEDEVYLCRTFRETVIMLESKTPIIHTTQPHFCQFRYGRIFVHYNGTVHEIAKCKCEGTNCEIKEGHNIEKMLLSGEFDWFKGE